jgi:hypothetical protein
VHRFPVDWRSSGKTVDAPLYDAHCGSLFRENGTWKRCLVCYATAKDPARSSKRYARVDPKGLIINGERGAERAPEGTIPRERALL